MPMNEEQIKAAIVRILELPEYQGAWYGASDKAQRNTRGNGVFDAIKETAARDLDAAANGGDDDAPR